MTPSKRLISRKTCCYYKVRAWWREILKTRWDFRWQPKAVNATTRLMVVRANRRLSITKTIPNATNCGILVQACGCNTISAVWVDHLQTDSFTVLANRIPIVCTHPQRNTMINLSDCNWAVMARDVGSHWGHLISLHVWHCFGASFPLYYPSIRDQDIGIDSSITKHHWPGTGRRWDGGGECCLVWESWMVRGSFRSECWLGGLVLEVGWDCEW